MLIYKVPREDGKLVVNKYSYVYDTNNEKKYYDSDPATGSFFWINNQYEKQYLRNITDINDPREQSAIYQKKISYLTSDKVV